MSNTVIARTARYRYIYIYRYRLQIIETDTDTDTVVSVVLRYSVQEHQWKPESSASAKPSTYYVPMHTDPWCSSICAFGHNTDNEQ